MFSHRRNSQKPGEGLYAAFKESFPEVGPGSSSAEPGSAPGPERSSALSDTLIDPPSTQRPFDDTNENKEQDATPKPYHDAWRLTPSMMDPNSFAFSAFANQPPGYYTPTPGGFNTLYHSQAGDLHTPGMGMNTPLSMPHSVHGLHAPDQAMHMQHFNPHMMHNPHAFHDLFSQHHHQQPHHLHNQQQQQQQSYAPQQFLQHQDSGYVAMDESPHKTTPNQTEMGIQSSILHQSISHGTPAQFSLPSIPAGEKFRYHTTLNAPTAMIKHADEIPITYLNKGQAYTISVFDTAPPVPQSNTPVKYRTYVRVSFEDEQQRARPGACWQLWKEGRGSNEAHQRGGKLLAVEYVDPNQGGDGAIRKSQVELEKASFDGFAVTWYPNQAAGVPDCSISVRFNFLSTDFSHSKGVKGIPVRLCSKSELVTPKSNTLSEPEVCFSKVKLFRDHGAERKLSNDVAHVKKTIEKLKQQISQAEAGIGSSGKRKRSGSMAKGTGSKPGKVVKHKRTWSVDSDVEVGRSAAEDDLRVKLVSMQDMFSSTRPVSILHLKGELEDDPDLHPVKLTGGDSIDLKPLERTATWDSRPSASDSPTSIAGSPSASSTSQPTPKRRFSGFQQSSILEEDEHELESEQVTRKSASPKPVKIMKLESEMKPQSDLLALDVDNSYQAPLQPPIKPVACFYVRHKDDSREYYRAVYLMQRTVKDLINGISQKFGIDPHRVTQVTHTNPKGLHIIVDEDVVREVPEGQDMLVEFAPFHGDHPVKHEFASAAASEVMVDGILNPANTAISDPLEMWINY